MKTGIDSPAGRLDTIPSSLTGGMLRYFTPEPLSELLERCKAFAAEIAPVEVVSADGLPFLISGALSLRGGQLDQRQSALLVDVALGNTQLESVPDLLAVGRRLGVRPEMRREMVYADAPIPSLASVIFAHHEAIPSLMDSLVDATSRARGEFHPYLVAVVTGFFCVHVHPFLDGNGRWSRVVAAATGVSSQALWESYIGALYMSACKEDLARTAWAGARNSGLREYVERALCFRKAFLENAEALIGDTERIFFMVSCFSKTRSCRRELLTAIYSKGMVNAESIRIFCNVSRKVADGRISELQKHAESYSAEDSGAFIRPPWQALLRVSDRARRVAMADVNCA